MFPVLTIFIQLLLETLPRAPRAAEADEARNILERLAGRPV
jgi:hypothetical protein